MIPAKKSIMACAIATTLTSQGAFAEACHLEGQVIDIKLEQTYNDDLVKSGEATPTFYIQPGNCGGVNVSAIILTADDVFRTLREFNDGTMDPNNVLRNSINALNQAADYSIKLKVNPKSYGLKASQVSYSIDRGVGPKL